jgi:ribonuclease HI
MCRFPHHGAWRACTCLLGWQREGGGQHFHAHASEVWVGVCVVMHREGVISRGMEAHYGILHGTKQSVPRAELYAMVHAVESVPNHSIALHIDPQAIVDRFNHRCHHSSSMVANQDLWDRLWALVRTFHARHRGGKVQGPWHHTRSHDRHYECA